MTTPENVLMHLKKIYADGELEELPTAKDFLAVRIEGKRHVRRQLKHYNLDAIISVKEMTCGWPAAWTATELVV